MDIIEVVSLEDRFRLNALLCESPHGAVWSGEDKQLRRPVAVTLLDETANEVIRERFEALIDGGIASLRAMTIARVVDAGRSGEGLPYLVTELQIDASSLADRFVSGPAIKVDAATRFVIDLLGSITKLAITGLSHGDIEPGNVLVVEGSGRLSPRLIGFGLNRATVREGIVELKSPEHLSTLGYMAPEQAGGSPSGGASADVFSTVAILYSWITGRVPFRGVDAVALRQAAGRLHVPRVGKVRPELTDTVLAAVIDKALSRDPSDRYADAAALTIKLRASLADTREARHLDVVVGERTIEPDASDAELSEERASGPTPLPETELSLPKPSELSPPRRPPKNAPAKEKKEPPAEAAEDERSAEAPAADHDEVEFENISGLLMIPDAGPPQRVEPLALPPPARRADSGERPPDLDAGEEEEVDAVLAGLEMDLEPSSEESEPAGLREVEARGEAEAPTAGVADGSEVAAPQESESPATTDEDVPPDEDGGAGRPADDPEDDAEAPSEEVPEAGDEPGIAASADALEVARTAAQEDPVEDYVLPASSPPWPVIGAGIAALALVLAGVAWFSFEGEDEDPSAAVAPAVQAGSEPEPAEVAEGVPDDPPVEPVEEDLAGEVVEHTVTLTGVPEGATVMVDGEAIDGTELTIVGEDREVEVRADGYEPWRATVDANSDPRLAVELTAVEPEPEVDEPPPDVADPGPATLTAAQRRRAERRRARRRRARRRSARSRSRPQLRVGPNPY